MPTHQTAQLLDYTCSALRHTLSLLPAAAAALVVKEGGVAAWLCTSHHQHLQGPH